MGCQLDDHLALFVPILAQAMRAVGIIEVDRQARGTIHAAVNKQAKELIEKNRSLIIYAEGTRPRDGVMKRFKKGAFTMAIAGALPVLPLSIHGTYEAAPSGRPWFFGGLRDQVRDMIAHQVTEMGGKVRD